MSLILSKKIYDLKDLPKKTGIYYFIDSNSIPIYIGKSLNIYKRVNQHLKSNTQKSNKIKSGFDHIRYLETRSEMIALLIESQEIKKNKPIFNRKLRRKKENININCFRSKSGHMGLKIGKSKEDNLTSFQSTNKAKTFINYISEKYNLCKKLNNIHLGEYCCNAISLSHNIKKCGFEENVKEYNTRFKRMINSLKLPNKKFLLIEKNNDKPYPFVSVKNGTIEGYGYLNSKTSEYKTNLRRLEFITKDELIIIKNYYKKNFESLNLTSVL